MKIVKKQGVTAVFDESVYQPPDFVPFRPRTWPLTDADRERIERTKAELDPVTLDVIEGALESAVDEAEAAIERTARSTIIREQHDYRAGVTTVNCDTVTHVSWSATPDCVRTYYTLEEMFDGDIFLYNDVYESQGAITHLPDYCVVAPSFAEGRIIAFVLVFGHTSDVGGRLIGSLPSAATTIYEEGIQVPPVKLYERGKLNKDVHKIVLRNTRFTDEMRGDIDAFVGAARLIDRRVRDLCKRHGCDVVEAAMHKMLDRCGDAIQRGILPLIPNGEFTGEDFLDNDGRTLDRPIKTMVTMRKDEEKIILDWTGTDSQTEGSVNWPVTGRILSSWLGAFFKQLVPGTVINDGVARVLRNYIRPGTILSPSYPAAVANRMATMFRCIGAYMVALTKAQKGQVVADYNCVNVYGFHGYDDDGRPFLYREIFGAGSGARSFADGNDAVNSVPSSRNLPAEFIEQRYPVLLERVGMNRDSGGPGKYRGGLGYVKDVRILRDCDFLTIVERTGFAPYGVSGGQAGVPGGSWINPGTAEETHIQFSHEAVPVRADDVVRVITPGGGGWGDPLERDAEAVRLDVLRGLVSIESARRDYGVVLVQTRYSLIPDYDVDEEETAQLRAEVRTAQPPLRLINRGEYAARMKAEGKIVFDDDSDQDWQETGESQEQH